MQHLDYVPQNENDRGEQREVSQFKTGPSRLQEEVGGVQTPDLLGEVRHRKKEELGWKGEEREKRRRRKSLKCHIYESIKNIV